MAPCQIRFSAERSTSHPDARHVVIVGKNVGSLSFEEVASKLQPAVGEKEWKSVLGDLHQGRSEAVNIYLNRAVIVALPSKCSRHNAPSRAHALTKAVLTHSSGTDETIVVVCQYADVFASGCAVARAYPLFTRKTSDAENGGSFNVLVEFICTDHPEKLKQADMEVLEAAARGVQLAARITDTPCNEMHTDQFIEEIRSIGAELELAAPLVIQGEALNQKGFGGIYGVGKAAEHKPALVVLSHTPQGAVKTVAWVGKGIVYDTGGLSIKTKTGMPGMKRDCGGAAGILGAFYTAVKAGFSENLHAVFCLAENSVSSNATRPDDIHTLYSGKTVEINNTDAEGRLVVSDGVVFAKKDLHADIILDMCTLTSAQGVATGKYHAAHLTNNEEWEGLCSEAGKLSGDLSFPVVYCPELHFKEFSSAVADMKNSVADRNNATSSCAGLFINAHLGFDFPGVWIHIDMAYPVQSGERSTGYGVALLNVLFGKLTKSELLNHSSPTVTQDHSNGVADSQIKKMRTE